MSQKIFDIVAAVDIYQNKNGEQKKRYTNCGTLMIKPDGRIAIKLDSIPVSPKWDGWLNCYEKNGNRKNNNSDDIPF